jgi:cobalt-zinc-cadmium efflux system membrane fusion protein
MLTKFANYLPTATVLLALAVVAYFGHRSDWKVPKISAMGSGDQASDTLAWCAEHGVLEAECVECRPELLPKSKDYGWCKEHGVPQCPLCHPDVAQTKEIASAMPEDMDRAKRALSLRPRAENNPKCILYRRRIQFTSLNAVKKAGVDVEPVDRAAIDEIVTANGQITYDHTRVAHLPAKSAGSVWRVDKKIGDRVVAGEVLALIDASDVGRSKAEFLEAMAKWEFASATKERLSPLSEKGTVSGSRLLEAETLIRESWSRVLRAQQALVNLGLPVSADRSKGKSADDIAADLQFSGLPNELAERFDKKSTTSNLLPVRASFNGIIIEADIVPGEYVDTAKPLFTIADTTQMWLTLDVPAEEADSIAIGQIVRFRSSGKNAAVSGRIEWISTEADAETRTIKVRAVLQNTDGKLRDETFGTGEIVLRSEADAIVVPTEALQWDGSCQVVFVRDKNFFASEQSPKLFYPRPVRVGARTEDSVEILVGVLPGEVVATKGSGVLRGELLKNNLGAG